MEMREVTDEQKDPALAAQDELWRIFRIREAEKRVVDAAMEWWNTNEFDTSRANLRHACIDLEDLREKEGWWQDRQEWKPKKST